MRAAARLLAPIRAMASSSGAALFGAQVLEEVRLSPDGGVMKAVLARGAGPTPARGDELVCHYTGKLDNGTVFDSSRSKCVSLRRRADAGA